MGLPGGVRSQAHGHQHRSAASKSATATGEMWPGLLARSRREQAA